MKAAGPTADSAEPPAEARFVSAPALNDFMRTLLIAGGSARGQAQDVANALVDASLMGTDSHGVRLVEHYAKVIRTGRINPDPKLAFTQTGPGTGTLDADDGFGHHAGYAAMSRAVELARTAGLAAVSVTNSSHFGAAGIYALEAVKSGMVGFAFTNSDSFVLPHDGLRPFHGTNPIAFSAPVPDEAPFLLDMATSPVPWNKTQDRMEKGLRLPTDVAVDANGAVTLDPGSAAALLPLGGAAFGYKGAGLASMVEVLSAVMTGMPYCAQLLGMVGPNWATPRHLGQFYLAIDPSRFVSRDLYDRAMSSYLRSLRSVPSREGTAVMSPGEREWSVRRDRLSKGIPVFPTLWATFEKLADEVGCHMPS